MQNTACHVSMATSFMRMLEEKGNIITELWQHSTDTHQKYNCFLIDLLRYFNIDGSLASVFPWEYLSISFGVCCNLSRFLSLSQWLGNTTGT